METRVPTKETFREFYQHTPPWDIGRPQKMFAQAASEISGSLLDVGCGTGEHALFFAQRGCKVTGADYLEEPIAKAKRRPPIAKLMQRSSCTMH